MIHLHIYYSYFDLCIDSIYCYFFSGFIYVKKRTMEWSYEGVNGKCYELFFNTEYMQITVLNKIVIVL